MMATSSLNKSDFRKIQTLDTCTVSNAIERLNGRLRNEGSIPGTAVRCQLPNLPPMLGYAGTGRMRSNSAPISRRVYNMNWWRYIASLPKPCVIVVQDLDDRLGAGALVGELHAAIAQALNCVGYVTNGSVRDLPAVEALGFSLFSGSLSVTHMFAHITEFGEPVEIGGLKILPGDLIHGDRHGVHTIPLTIASEIPRMAAQIEEEKSELKHYCRSSQFSLEGLAEKLQAPSGDDIEDAVKVG